MQEEEADGLVGEIIMKKDNTYGLVRGIIVQ